MIRVAVSVSAIFFAVAAVSTVLLYLRTQTRPTLIMFVAVIVGWLSVGIGWFGPKETVTTRIPTASAERSSDSFPQQPQARIGAVSTRTSSVFPVTWIVFGSLLLWAGGLLAYSISSDRRRK